ncbi:hypothetical protein PTKIN_Ptkin17bG0145000 [Pterospermum kingtungense]
MSVTGVSDPERVFKKSFHRRNDSGELDVFEAARYFSGYNEAAAAAATSYNCVTFTQKIMREDQRLQPWRSGGGRISLDVAVPMRSSNSNHLPQQTHHHHVVEKQVNNKEKIKYKQPSSPGGRLASFLNSLFNQTGSKKKKSKSTTTQFMKDHHEEESPGGRRKRRSSISHFRSSSTTADTKSFYSSSSSGFRTPPPYAHTPTKSHKEFRSYSDHHKQVVSLSKQTKSTTDQQKNRNRADHRSGSEERDQFRKFSEVVDDDDDGADSDSSSDLFELQNYDLGIYSSGLPVYETTHMDSIKRGAPISSGAL